MSMILWRGIIEYHDEVKPTSRIKIAEFLREASLKKGELNDVEVKELDWFFEEYAYELENSYHITVEPGGDSLKSKWYLYD